MPPGAARWHKRKKVDSNAEILTETVWMLLGWGEKLLRYE